MLLKMSKDGWKLQERQKGFTLVNVAALVVSSGVAFGVAVQGPDMLDAAKYERFQQDLSQMENVVWDYKTNTKRWPGDCNQDGVISYQPQHKVSSDVSPEHFVSETSSAASEACQRLGTGTESVNASFADLRLSGLTDDVSNRVISKHSLGDFFQIGHAQFSQTRSANVIVAYGIPASVARYVDNQWDGSESGQQGRIRRWDTQADGATWPEGDQKVSLAYYFDQKLP